MRKRLKNVSKALFPRLTDAMLDSVSGMEGATPEALEQLRSGLLGILQFAAERENAHEADE